MLFKLHQYLIAAIVIYSWSGMSWFATADELSSATLQNYVSEVCDFEIDMLPDPKHESSDPTSRTSDHKFLAGNKVTGFHLVHYKLERTIDKMPTTAAGYQELLQDVLKPLKADKTTRVLSSKVIDQGGVMGYEVGLEYENAKGTEIRIRTLFGTNVPGEIQSYILLATGPEEFMTSERITSFFNSFKHLTSASEAKKKPR